MPTSTTDLISASLKQSFRNGFAKFEESLLSVGKKSLILSNPVIYDPPIIEYPGVMMNGSATSHYIHLNPSSQSKSNGHIETVVSTNGNHNDSEFLPKPKMTFYRRQDVRVGYTKNRSPGSGMINVGNTCYLNSTLQALFHTPALVNYLSDLETHYKECSLKGFSHQCTICALSLTLVDTQRTTTVRPSRIYEKLKRICKHLVHGRQEDAHEFLRYLIESLQKSFLATVIVPHRTLDDSSKETTPFNQIFGGYLRQDVTCLRCKYVSTTFQHFMDLLLDIQSSSTITDALSHYFRVEKIGGNLDGSNMYKCEKCKVKVPARKSCIIERPPVVLCIQLKRFGITGGKISKAVQLSRRLDASGFVRQNSQRLEYRLVSMITHVGSSPNCGHYTAIGEAANGQFYQFDDTSVRPVSVSQALNTASYVIMYEMTNESYRNWVNYQESMKKDSINGISSSILSDSRPGNSITIKSSVTKPSIDNKCSRNSLSNTISSFPSSSIKAHILENKSVVEKNDSLRVSNEENNVASISSEKKSTDKKIKEMSSSQVKRLVSYGLDSSSDEGEEIHSGNISSSIHKKNVSGHWIVTDLDTHNPSIHSDNSTGSTNGNWIVSDRRSSDVRKGSVGLSNGSSQSTSEDSSTEPHWKRKRKNYVFPEGNFKKKCDWNGSFNNSSAIVDELVFRSSNSQITNWNGEARPNKTTPYKDSRRSRYDEDLDRGRVKKIKRRHSEPLYGRWNPFQAKNNSNYNGNNYNGNHYRSFKQHHHHRSLDRKTYRHRH